jgi:hypothetical protein
MDIYYTAQIDFLLNNQADIKNLIVGLVIIISMLVGVLLVSLFFKGDF